MTYVPEFGVRILGRLSKMNDEDSTTKNSMDDPGIKIVLKRATSPAKFIGTKLTTETPKHATQSVLVIGPSLYSDEKNVDLIARTATLGRAATVPGQTTTCSTTRSV